jgi:hypothetical protein
VLSVSDVLNLEHLAQMRIQSDDQAPFLITHFGASRRRISTRGLERAARFYTFYVNEVARAPRRSLGPSN